MVTTENWRIFFRNGFVFRFSIVLFVLFILVKGGMLFPYGAISQPLESAPPKSDLDWTPAESDLSPDPSVVAKILQNGFRYVMMENREPKDRVSMHLLVQAGSLHESESESGIAHYLEHMMFNGSENFPPGELVKYFQLIGMQFGPDANAHTSFRQTVYDVLLPAGNRESVEDGLVVLKDYAQGALLLQEEIDRERGIILAEKRSRDSASYRTYVAALKFEFPDARFSHRLPIGEESVIRSADTQLMKQFYDRWYRPDNMVLVMVGQFDVPGAEKLVQKMFGDMSARAPGAAAPEFGEISHEGLKTFYHHEPEIGATSVSIEAVRKVEKPADSKKLRKEDVLRSMAQRMLQNRLEEMVSKPDAPFTSASTYIGRSMQQIGYAEISANCPPENWKLALAQTEQTLRQALDFGFNENELVRVKREFVSYLETAVAQAVTRESGDLANEIIWHINNERVFLSPAQEASLLVPYINGVTLEVIHEALKKAWAPDHRLVLVTGNASLEDGSEMSPEKQIRAVYEASARQAVKAMEESRHASFPYLPKPASPGKITSRRNVEDLGITQVDFENGVRLNLKQTEFEADKVRVSIAFGDGKCSEPADQAGLAMLTEEVLNESGLGRLDKNELAYALAGTQVNSSFEISEDRFSMRGACASQETELLMQLLYARFMDPGFRPDALHLAMARFEQAYQSLSSDIDGAMNLKGRKFLAGGDSRFGMPSLDQLKGLNLGDIRAWALPLLEGSRLEVNVVGEMDPDAVIELVSLYFGSLPEKAPPLEQIPSTSIGFPMGESLDIRVDTKIEKGMVVVAYPTDDYWDISRTRRTSVLADIFSEKLRKKIREQLGASYSPFAYNQPSRAYAGYGVLQAYVHVAPEQASVVADAVKEISRDILENGVSAEDLERSLKPILTSIKDYRRTNTYWLDRVMTDSLRHPQQLDWSRSFEADYAAITVEDIRKVAAAYLVNKKAACITIVPSSFPSFSLDKKNR
jgi:zinc protease